jgi:hypothetical protein
MKKITLFLFYCISIVAITGCNAQNKDFGTLTGKLYDSKTNDALIQATLILFKDSIVLKKNKTDFDGKFKIDSIPLGTYNLKIEYIGFKPVEIRDIVIKSKKTSTLVLGFNQEVLDLSKVKVEWSGGYVSFIDSTGNFKCVKSE